MVKLIENLLVFIHPTLIYLGLKWYDSQKDTDDDDLTDDLDTCANTPEAAIVDEDGCVLPPLYLDIYGVTIKASANAIIGESYGLDGVSYLVVDSTMLYDMVASEEDVTKVVTTNVTNMRALFFNATSFDQDISNWDVSNVSSVYKMFNKASNFNQDIGSWDVSNVHFMIGMFYKAISFNQDILIWNVSKVTMYEDFSKDATAWTLPKPNFTNCSE